ncbi:hypothetical protein OG333_36950 [Streptomyces anulatus]|uniref:hypothetical protein n=1 Tax=Streptomyces anulatus TaxID=1892 RepID=UPI0033F287D3|nr:hypothetical protein OG333_36950 [Streptomyces anulatus]
MSIFCRRKPTTPRPAAQDRAADLPTPADRPLGREAARQATLSLAAATGPFLIALLEWWTRTH